MNKAITGLIIAPIIAGMIFVTDSLADQSSIDRFVGEYQGVAVDDPNDVWLPADLNISIQPHDEGFIMEWVMVTKRDDGKVVRQKITVKFHPAQIRNVYAAAMRPNLFGGWVPLDPFNGDPFMWARFLDSTLTVYAMIITDTGAHDMQIHERTLTPDGLAVRFKRLRDEQPLRVQHGALKRVN